MWSTALPHFIEFSSIIFICVRRFLSALFGSHKGFFLILFCSDIHLLTPIQKYRKLVACFPKCKRTFCLFDFKAGWWNSSFCLANISPFFVHIFREEQLTICWLFNEVLHTWRCLTLWHLIWTSEDSNTNMHKAISVWTQFDAYAIHSQYNLSKVIYPTNWRRVILCYLDNIRSIFIVHCVILRNLSLSSHLSVEFLS